MQKMESFASDIDECAEGISGCTHRSVNTEGTYYCTCPSGYELFTTNGEQGYSIYHSADKGLYPRDRLHYNHTCICMEIVYLRDLF